MPKSRNHIREHVFKCSRTLSFGCQPLHNIEFEPKVHLVVPVANHLDWGSTHFKLFPVNSNNFIPLVVAIFDTVIPKAACNDSTG